MNNTNERAAFLAERKTGIGGSDAAAVLGISQYKTPLKVWLEKTGEEIDISDDERRYWGRALEAPVLKRYEEDTGRVSFQKAMQRDAAQTYVIANPDGVSYARANGLPTDPRVVEVKTSSYRKEWGENGSGDVPPHYMIQAQHYMMVLGLTKTDFPVLFNGREFCIFTVEADQELHKMMRMRYAKFWQYVESKTPPPVVDLDDARILYAKSNPTKREATIEIVQALDGLKELRKQADAINERADKLRLVIMNFMEDADTLTFGQDTLVTWKTAKARETFDSKALKAQNPELYAQFSKTGAPSRRFLIQGD